LLLITCKEPPKEKPFVLDGKNLKTLIENYINGDSKSKKMLAGFFSYAPPNLSGYNKIIVDSLLINNRNYYSLLLEHQNPVFNLFAIFDKKLNLILKDESINGFLNVSFNKSGSRIYAVLNEDFRTKDCIELKRTSYYSLDEYFSDIVFRQYTYIKTPSLEAVQTIFDLADTAFITGITTISVPKKKIVKDVFRFDVSTNKYLSTNNLFDSLVYREIRKYKKNVTGNQITDEESIYQFYDSANPNKPSTQFIIDSKDFEIKLDNLWKKVGNVTISNLVKRKINGIKYLNTKTSAAIYIAEIAATDSAESYFNEELLNNAKYKSNVRFSEKLIDTEKIYQLFEYSCATKKILFIIEAPKKSFDTYNEVYENIIKTFKVKC
jgi:hypothetical protein